MANKQERRADAIGQRKAWGRLVDDNLCPTYELAMLCEDLFLFLRCDPPVQDFVSAVQGLPRFRDCERL